MSASQQTSPTIAEQIAEVVGSLTLTDIPDEVLAVAKAHALDALGIAVASTAMEYGEAIHTAGRLLGSGDESHAIGFGTSLPAPSAALINGTLIHGLDFDDTHIGAIYHATAPALAAALAVGEAENADGATTLLAFVIGLEVGIRLAKAGAGEFHARGFHPTGNLGTFAAACVAAKIRGLSAATLTSALGLCGSQAAGILEVHDSWLKRMHPGWAAHAGVIATTMAQAGFRGPARVFDGPGGFYQSHLGRIPSAEDLGLDDLGSRWLTADIALKPYPCCHFTHAFADAAFGLLDELGVEQLSADDVESIVCPTSEIIIPMVCEPAEEKVTPSSIYDALFSVQYVTARALVTRRVDLAAFYDEPLDDPAVLAMAAKVTCPPDTASDFPKRFPGEVRIRLTDGRDVHRRVPASFGTHEWPMTPEDIRTKFALNAGRRLSAEQVEQLAATVDGFENLVNVGQVVAGCRVPAATSAM